LKIDQSSVSTTKKACDPPIAQQEAKFLALLKGAQRYTISTGELRITAGKEVLVFVPYVEEQ
jgi:heat shock protein HslJ